MFGREVIPGRRLAVASAWSVSRRSRMAPFRHPQETVRVREGGREEGREGERETEGERERGAGMAGGRMGRREGGREI